MACLHPQHTDKEKGFKNFSLGNPVRRLPHPAEIPESCRRAPWPRPPGGWFWDFPGWIVPALFFPGIFPPAAGTRKTRTKTAETAANFLKSTANLRVYLWFSLKTKEITLIHAKSKEFPLKPRRNRMIFSVLLCILENFHRISPPIAVFR